MDPQFYIVLFIILLLLVATVVIVLILATNSTTTSTSSKDLVVIHPPLNPTAKLYADTHAATALVLGCIDYRLIDNLVANIEDIYQSTWDLVVMAGSELFVVNKTKNYYPSFSPTFFDNVDIAIELHHIQLVVAVSHEDCGAYKVFYGDDDDYQRHVDNLTALGEMVRAKYQLPFIGYYLSLDGTMKEVVTSS